MRYHNHDLRDITIASQVSKIGIVTQETYLLHDTIQRILLYRSEHATELEAETVVRPANLHDFMMELSDGYETIVGE